MQATLPSLWSLLQKSGYGVTQRHDNLAFVPLHLPPDAPEQPSYMLLSDALAQRQAVIGETNRATRLEFQNLSSQALFAPAGSYFQGGMQDRMLTISVVLAGHSHGNLPTRCVERGSLTRPATSDFSTPAEGSIAPSTIIAGTQETVQDTVWQTIANYDQTLGSRSRTQRLSDVYQHSRSRVEQWERRIVAPAASQRSHGALFVVQSATVQRWILDIFGHPSLFQRLFPALLQSAALTAVAEQEAARQQGRPLPPIDEEAVKIAKTSAFDICRRTELREELSPINAGTLRTGKYNGYFTMAFLEHDGQPVHLQLRRN
jgi:hypothetical protein